jgi:hypothetical protein
MPVTYLGKAAARAVGRCQGAMFFSVFGGAWLLLAAYASARLNALALVVVSAVVVASS